jgi:hypothetical protein
MSNYSINKTFEDSSINVVLDRIYYEVVNALPNISIDKMLGLTGRAAAVLQEQSQDDLENVIFITNDTDIFNFFQTALPEKIDSFGVARLKDRTLYYFPGFYFEIWFSDSENLGLVNVGGIFMQSYNKINTLFL